MNTTKNFTVFFGLILAAFLSVLSQVSYAGVAGHAQFVNGQVQVTNKAGQVHTLQKADEVNESDTVTTAKKPG